MFTLAVNHCSNRWFLPLLLALVGILIFAPRALHAQAPTFDQRQPFGTPLDLTVDLAVGDIDGDGDLDIITKRTRTSFTTETKYELVLNNGDGSFAIPRDIDDLGTGFAGYSVDILSLGDLDGDGDLDLITESDKSYRVYFNDGVGNFAAKREFGSMQPYLALGDVDGDGDIDMVTGNSNEAHRVYVNDGAGNFATARSFGADVGSIVGVALGDLDGDQDLDFITIGGAARVYLNDSRGNFPMMRPLGSLLESVQIAELQVGDMDSDGNQDIVIATKSGQSLLYLNDGVGNFPVVYTLGDTNAPITKLALGDVDDDGDLDMAAANDSQSSIYLNNGAGNFTLLPSFSSPTDQTCCVALGDMDGDGDLDLIAGGYSGPNVVYFNNGAGNFVVPHPFGAADVAATQVATGDMNGDHMLDLIVAGGATGGALGVIYFNAGDGSFHRSNTFGFPHSIVRIAVADMDGDMDLDVVASSSGFQGKSAVYFNDGSGNLTTGLPFDSKSLNILIPAIGDLDNDGDLDIVIASSGNCGIRCSETILLYFNNGVGEFSPSQPFGEGETISIALGDVDNDGDLDIATAHYEYEASGAQLSNAVYLNDGQGKFLIKRPFGLGSDETSDMALADIDGDSDLDIVAANNGNPGTIYLNDGLGNFAVSRALGSWINAPQQVATADVDGDGDLDIIANGSSKQNFIYLNDGAGNFATPITFAGTLTDLATGDMDRDGDIDIVTVNNPGQGVVYLNRRGAEQIVAQRPGRTALADLFSTPEILSEQLIPISYRLTSADSLPVGSVAAFYSINGGGQWQPAVASSNTITQNLATSPTGVEHQFIWDTFATGFFGQGDNVVLRFVAYPQARPSLPVTLFPPRERQPYLLFFPLLMQSSSPLSFNYTNLVAGPYQRPFASTVTLPFRVRGTQVRVFDSSGQPTANAQVYQLAKGSSASAELFPTATQPLTTTHTGYLPGRGALAIEDQLVALQPLRRGPNYTVYATSAAPNENGLALQAVTQPGVQTLQVSAAHPLVLFDLDIALEWDAVNDGLFYAQLTTAIQRASAILFDVSDGQIALGEVRIHPDRTEWLGADVVLYANNNLRPRASMGGTVDTARDETQGLRGNLPNAYLPGQVRMGPLWDPFGQNGAELTQDWQRALAHELAHYLLFLPDNYLGVENGLLRITNCSGSFMTDAYNPGYSEFLTPIQWRTPNDPASNPCLRTVAASLLTGRSDWETVTHFYPELHIPQASLSGPALLPLNVTRVRVAPPPTTKPQPVAARNYDLRDESGSVTVLRQAQAYVLQSQGTPTTDDDALLYLGSTGVGSDRILVRGAVTGDKVCVLDSASDPVRTGCETVTPQSTSIQVRPVPGWRPDIQVTPLTSTTFQITVTQAFSVGQLSAQLLPAYGPISNAAAIQAIIQPLTPVDATHYTTHITAAYPVFEGFVRVYAAGAPEQQQAITQFFLSEAWGPSKAWSGANRAWGANIRSLEAPTASGDGKVTILNLTDLLADTGTSVLQAVTDLPNLPPWLTPVGPGYRFAANSALPRTILFQYNQRDVPPGYETTLAIYYLLEGQPDWERLTTGPLASGVDGNDNLAVAVMPDHERGEGIYALMATVELPPLTPGWNPFNYPVVEAQSVTRTLAALGAAYTTVYAYQPNMPLPWPVYDRTVDPAFAPLVNTLMTMTFGRNYLIYATAVVTPYISVIGDGGTTTTVNAATRAGLVEPPALFYGNVIPQPGFVADEGMVVNAKIGAVICGESQVQRWQGTLVFVIQVKADSGNGCGKAGQTVQFEIGGQGWPLSAIWDNRQANHLLNSVANNRQTQHLIASVLHVYLPVVAR